MEDYWSTGTGGGPLLLLGRNVFNSLAFTKSRESSDRWVATAGRGGPRVTHLVSKPRGLPTTVCGQHVGAGQRGRNIREKLESRTRKKNTQKTPKKSRLFKNVGNDGSIARVLALRKPQTPAP